MSGKTIIMRLLTVISAALLLSVSAFAQNITVSGTVVDGAGAPVIGASVMVQGTSQGVITDFDGKYTLANVPSKGTLEYASLGYATVKELVNGRTTINVTLQEDNEMLNETVVVGYATGSKRTISGAVESVKKSEMNSGVVVSPLDALKGKVAGVVISQAGGDPMGSSNVRIRGTSSLSGGNDPLVIIDGVFGDMAMLNAIAPGDIETVTVLKDASETAQYGSRGAAGVLVITTARGKKGYANVDYEGFIGLNSIYKSIDVLSADEYRAAANKIGKAFDDLKANTDWYDAILNKSRMTHTHNLSFSNGSDNSNMRASLGYNRRDGAVLNSFSENYTVKLNMSQYMFNKKVQIDLGVFASERSGNNIYNNRVMFYSAAAFNPTYPTTINPEDGMYYEDYNASEVSNPLGQLQIKNQSTTTAINTNGKIAWTIVDGLVLSAFGSYNKNLSENKKYIPNNIKTGRTGRGSASITNANRSDVMGNIQLSYNKDIAKHHVGALALMEGQRYSTFSSSTGSSGFDTNYFEYNNLLAGAVVTRSNVSSNATSYLLSSYMGRLNYSYDDKYIVTLNARADGSSKLGSGHKWGFFPSASAAWVINRENFMKNVRWINTLKLRVGYGVTGNQDAISAYNSLQVLAPNAVTSINGVATTTFSIQQNDNPDLKWETKYTFDAGIDATMFDGRLSATLDYYRSTTKDLLYTYTVSVPPFTYPTLLANLGEMTNNGLELAFKGDIVKTKDFGLTLAANASIQHNKLVSLHGTYKGEELSTAQHIKVSQIESPGLSQNNGVAYLIEGQPIGSFYLPTFAGFSDQNQYILEDTDKNGTVDLSDDGDRTLYGQSIPKYYLNLSLSARYKNLDLTAQLNGAFGHMIYNGTSATLCNLSSFPTYNVIGRALTENDGKGIYDNKVSNYWLEKGDYMNLEYITLGYNFGKKVISGNGLIKSLRLAFSINNVHTFTGYTGMTPMINNTSLAFDMGVDAKNIYPLSRTYSLKATVKF